MADIKISEITDKASNSELSTARLIAAIPDGSGGFDTKYIEGLSSSSSSTEGGEAFCSSGGSFCFAGNHRAVVFNAEDNTYYKTDLYNPFTSNDNGYKNNNTFVGMLNNNGTEFRNGVAMNIAGYDGSFIVAGNHRAAVFSKATKTWYATDYSNAFTSTNNSYKNNNTFTAMIDADGSSWSTGSNVAQRVDASNGNFIVTGNHRAVVFMLSENADKNNTNAIWHATDMTNPFTGGTNSYKNDNTFVAILNDDGNAFRGNDLPMSINAKNGNFIVGGNIGAAVFNKDTKQWYKTDTANPFTSSSNSYKNNNTFVAMLNNDGTKFRISSDNSGQTIATLNVSSSGNNFAAIGNHRAGVFTLSDNTWRVTDMTNPFTGGSNSYKNDNTFMAMLDEDGNSWSTGSTVAQNISDCS